MNLVQQNEIFQSNGHCIDTSDERKLLLKVIESYKANGLVNNSLATVINEKFLNCFYKTKANIYQKITATLNIQHTAWLFSIDLY